MVDLDRVVNPVRVEETIHLLREAVTSSEIDPLLSALEALRQNPEDTGLLEKLDTAFYDLGIMQGVVLTYGPYVGVLVSNNPFGND